MTARTRAALALTALAVSALAAPLARADGLPGCSVAAGAGWTSTPAPDLSEYENPYYADGGELVAHTLEPSRPQHRWIAAPAVVLATHDGGCTWSEAVALPEVPTAELPLSHAVHRLERLLTGRTDRDEQRVVALGRSFAQEVVVLRSDAGGAHGSWQSHPQPQMTGNLLGATIAPGDADRLYAAVDRGVVALLEVHVSDDGGRTWSLASSLDAAGQRAAGAVGHAVLAVDPADPDTVFLSANDSSVLRSTDAGRTWTQLDGPRKAGGLALHRGQQRLSVVAADRADALVRRSTDGGDTFVEHGTGAPKPFRSLTHGRTRDQLLAVQGPTAPRFYDQVGMSIWRWDAGTASFRDITPDGAPLLYEAVLTEAGDFVLHGPDGLWTWHGDRLADEDSDGAAGPGRAGTRLLPATPPPPAPARLTTEQHVVLRPGEERRVEVRLDLPARPRDLDLVLLFDTTNSMSGTIDALRSDAQRLVDALASRGNRTRFGVAEFQDYPIAPYGQPANRAYARLRDLAPVDAALDGHLAGLSTRDDLDVQTSGLTALLQLTTGAGQSGLPRAPQSEDPNVAPGQGMSFHPEAVKVVVTFGDEPFHDSPAHPGPALADVVEALRGRGVLAAGVAVGGRPAGAGPDLRRVAAATGAVAPVEVDCGDAVVPAGAPLVCDVGAEDLRLDTRAPGSRFVEAVTALVDAVPSPARVSLTAVAPAGLTVDVSPAADVDLRDDSVVQFTLTVRCAEPTAGTPDLAARVGDVVVARAGMPVTCGDAVPAPAAPLPGAAAAVPALPIDASAAAVAGVPPAAPPTVVQVPAAAAQPAPAGAASGAAAPGTSTAVGLAGAPGEAASDRARAFTDGRSGELPLAAVPLAGGLLATAAATTHLLATRRRPSSPAVVRTRHSGGTR